ncbi:hypothetical protein GCM10009826_46720 [Humibacillus xanthopallidus]
MRIAHLTTVDMSLALLLGTELAVDIEQGHTVFGISAPGPYVERIESLGVTHVPVVKLTRSWDPRSDAAAFRGLVRTIRGLELDVLHTHNPKTGVMGRIAGRLAGVPVVVNTCHGLWALPDDHIAKRSFVYALEGLAARFSDFELFQNAEDLRTQRWALKRGRHRVVGNGVDLGRFSPDPEGRRRVRSELGIAHDQLLVGTVGRRVREKGLAEFTQTANRLANKAAFVWVGPADETDGRADAEVCGASAVRFVEERQDMPSVYSALDVFVLASYREGFSRASMEAAACGVPMVLTDIRGCREIGDDGIHLLLASPNSAESLTRAVDRLLDHPDLRVLLAAAARTRALERFDQHAVARLSMETYAAVAHRKGAALGLVDDNRTTVLHVLPSDLDRGAQVYAGRLRDALKGDPSQRHLAASLFEAPEAALRADVRLHVRSGPMRRAGLDPQAVTRLRRAVRKNRVNVIVAHGGESLKYAIAAAGRTPTIYYKVGLSSNELARGYRKWLYRFLAARATRVVGVSEAIVQQANNLLRIPRGKLTLIPNGRDPSTYSPPPAEAGNIDRALVLFVGHLEPGKRPGLFLDVIEVLRSRNVEFGAAIVGDGPLRHSLGARAAALGVNLMGVRTDVPQLLRQASLLAMTSDLGTEGMPGVLIEAGLSGLPVVSTAAAGVADIVDDGVTGFVITTDRPEDIADRIEELLADGRRHRDMGTQARLRCERLFSIDATANLWWSLVAGQIEDGSVNTSRSWRGRGLTGASAVKDQDQAGAL